MKELLNKGLYLNAIEVAESCTSGKISKLQIVLERMVWTLMKKPIQDCYEMIRVDAKGNLLEAEGSENIKSACWMQIKKTLSKNSNEPSLIETIITTILNCNKMYKIPSFLVQLLDTVNLSHLYMKYGRLQDAASVLLEGLKKGDYIDSVIYAKVCEGLKELDKPEVDWLLKRLNNYH